MTNSRTTTCLLSIVCFGIAAGFGVLTVQFFSWAEHIRAEPTEVRAADLLAGVPNGNHRVRLKDYVVGTPFIENKGDKEKLQPVWLPIYPTGAARDPKQPPIVFFAGKATDAATLRGLLQPPQPLEGVVGNGLFGLPNKVFPALADAFPGLTNASPVFISPLDFDPNLVPQVLAVVTALFGLAGLIGLWKAAAPAPEATAIPHTVNSLVPEPRPGNMVRRYRGAADAIPPEILALGEATSLHTPWWMLDRAGKNQTMFVAAGVLTFGLGVVLMSLSTGPQGGAGTAAALGLFVAGFVVAVLPWLAATIPTYLVYDQALVLVVGNEFTVLPWDGVAGLDAPRFMVTSDAQRCDLSLFVDNLGGLYDAVKRKVRERLLPQALAALGRGELVTFGLLDVSRAGIGYKGKVLGWDRIRSLKIVNTRGWRTLNVSETSSLFAWATVDLNKTPNDWLFLELLTQEAPGHLLVRVS